jgi:chromate transport protein ChrA
MSQLFRPASRRQAVRQGSAATICLFGLPATLGLVGPAIVLTASRAQSLERVSSLALVIVPLWATCLFLVTALALTWGQSRCRRCHRATLVCSTVFLAVLSSPFLPVAPMPVAAISLWSPVLAAWYFAWRCRPEGARPPRALLKLGAVLSAVVVAGCAIWVR